MFEDFQGFNTSSSQSSCPSSSDFSCSFDSTGSFGSVGSGSTGSWETPSPSTRRPSLDSFKLEDMPPSTVNTPEQVESSNYVSAMSSSMTYGMVSSFPDQSMLFSASKIQPGQTVVGFNSFSVPNSEGLESFNFHDGLHLSTPTLEMDLCSPISGIEPSPVSMGFVVPSQTTFMNNYNMDSPMPPPRMLQFQSPTSDFNQDYPIEHSPIDNMNFLLQYQDCKSTSTTPSRISTTCRPPSTPRQPIFKPSRTSAALQQVQSDSQAVRQARRRVKRELSSGLLLPNNIRIQYAATKLCPWAGCGKRFKRQEHLKRHERIHRPDPVKDSFECEFCLKPFNRSDNLKSHIKLHTDPDRSQKRTNYHPRAQVVWESMNRKTKRKPEARPIVKSRVMAYRGARQRVSTIAPLE